jgi:hypothetical protein
MGYCQRAAAKEDDASTTIVSDHSEPKAFIIVVAALVTWTTLGVNITAASPLPSVAWRRPSRPYTLPICSVVAVFMDKPFRIRPHSTDQADGTVETIGCAAHGLQPQWPSGDHLNKTVGNATIPTSHSGRTSDELNIGITCLFICGKSEAPKLEEVIARIR